MKNSNLSLSTKNFIIVTGLTKSGKTAVAPILCSLKNCEQFFFNTIVENLTVYNYLKLINDKITKNLIIRAVNEEIFDKIYGRNLNNKKNDFTNLSKYKGDVDYKKRILMTKSESFTKKVLKKNYFPILFHEALINLKLLENVFYSPKIINISRHPVDIVNSWIKKDYVDDYFESFESGVITISYKNKVLPFFLKGCESELKFCESKEDKIVLMQHNLKKIFEKNYKSSKKKKNIILIRFDDFLLDTDKFLHEILIKFNLKFSKKTNQALKEQNCPRKIDISKRLKTKDKIVKNLSPRFKEIFEKMINHYDNNLMVF
jgi:hypothetical protein